MERIEFFEIYPKVIKALNIDMLNNETYNKSKTSEQFNNSLIFRTFEFYPFLNPWKLKRFLRP